MDIHFNQRFLLIFTARLGGPKILVYIYTYFSLFLSLSIYIYTELMRPLVPCGKDQTFTGLTRPYIPSPTRALTNESVSLPAVRVACSLVR